MGVVSMKQLLECGVHFGHQTRRWNPKMKPFIFTERNGIYIIDLQKTVKGLEKAYDFVREIAKSGGNVLFVGTKRQAQDPIRDEATKAGQFYINQRWLGGLLTNFTTIRRRVMRMAELEQMEEDGSINKYPKKEVIQLRKEREKLEKYLSGIKDMRDIPDALFVIDPRRETIAVLEARKLGIPVIAIVDTNGRQGQDARIEEAAEEAAPEAEELPVIDEDETVEDEVKVRVKEMADQKGWKETN